MQQKRYFGNSHGRADQMAWGNNGNTLGILKANLELKHISFSELVVLAVDRATTVTKNEFVNFEHAFFSWVQDKIHKAT